MYTYNHCMNVCICSVNDTVIYHNSTIQVPKQLLWCPATTRCFNNRADAQVSQANKPRKRGATGELDSLQHPLLGDRPTLQLIRPRDEGRRNGKPGFLDWWFLDRPEIKRKTTLSSTPMKIEPKTFFANERTFLSWLHMAVTIGSIACALLGFAGSAHRSKKQSVRGGRCDKSSSSDHHGVPL